LVIEWVKIDKAGIVFVNTSTNNSGYVGQQDEAFDQSCLLAA
jgi:hypothetical protein